MSLRGMRQIRGAHRVSAARSSIDALGNPVGATLFDAQLNLTSAVTIAAGSEINTVVQANPTNTKFALVPGQAYTMTTSVIPKTGIQIIGRRDSNGNPNIITGSGTVDRAIRGNSGAGAGTGWTIQNCVFTNFTSTTLGAVSLNTGCLLDHCEIYNIANTTGVGLWLGGTGAQYCWIHDNGQYGVAGGGANNCYLKNCDVSYNNTAHGTNGTSDAGGTKWAAGAHDMVVQYNYVHHNGGSGLWWDGDAYNITCDSNTVQFNDFVGIDYEISWGPCTITNNWVEGNALYYLDPAHSPGSSGSILYGADIGIPTSAGATGYEIEVANNTVITGLPTSIYGNGIGLITQPRNTTTRNSTPNGSGGWVFPIGTVNSLTHVYVHNNNVTIQYGADTAAGMAGSVTAAYSDTSNRFVANTYHTPDLTSSWWQWNGGKTKAQWQAVPEDAAGTFLTP